jgi:predicted Abi (CAAX) family protease
VGWLEGCRAHSERGEAWDRPLLSMAGGYENEDRMAELEEARRLKEKEAYERLKKARQELMAPGRDTATDPTSAAAR